MADTYGAVPQYETLIDIPRSGGSDSRRPRTPVLAILFATAAVAAVAAVTILGQPQGSAAPASLVELLGADGVRDFEKVAGLSHQGAVSMLSTMASVQMLSGTVDSLDGGDNMAKADKYLSGSDDEAKALKHIEGGVLTAQPAEEFFDKDANVETSAIEGGGLCGKRDTINEKLSALLLKLKASLLPAKRTVVALADSYIAAQEAYLLTESNFRDSSQEKDTSCGGIPNAVTNDATAKDAHVDATQVLKEVTESSADELAAVKSEKSMIIMLLTMIGTLHDIAKTDGVNIGSDSVGKDEDGISDIMKTQVEAKASPQQLSEAFTNIKKLSLRIHSPALASKLQAFPTSMLAAYKESSEVTEILKSLLTDLDTRQTALEALIQGATDNRNVAADAAQTATLALVNIGEACDDATEMVLANDSARGPAKGDAEAAKSTYVLGKVTVPLP